MGELGAGRVVLITARACHVSKQRHIFRRRSGQAACVAIYIFIVWLIADFSAFFLVLTFGMINFGQFFG